MRRDPSPTAYDARPYNVSVDGKYGSTTIPAGDSMSGRLKGSLPEQHTDMSGHMSDVSGPARGLPQGR